MSAQADRKGPRIIVTGPGAKRPERRKNWDEFTQGWLDLEESGDLIVYHVSLEGVILKLNHDIEGVTAVKEALNTSIYEHIVPEDHETLAHALFEMERGHNVTYEVRSRTEKDDLVNFRVHGTPVYKKGEEGVSHVILVSEKARPDSEVREDVGRLSRRAGIREATQILSHNAAGTAHVVGANAGAAEVKIGLVRRNVERISDAYGRHLQIIRERQKDPGYNPLPDLEALGEFLSEAANEISSKADEAKEDMRRAREGIRGFADIGEQITALIQSGNFKQTYLSLNAVLDAQITRLEAAYRGSKIVVEKNYQGNVTILGNEGLIGDVFYNLLLNAAEAMPNGGTISVRQTYQFPLGRAYIRITDEGVGIDPENWERVFLPQWTSGKKQRGGARGIGLWGVDSILQSHYGDANEELGRQVYGAKVEDSATQQMVDSGEGIEVGTTMLVVVPVKRNGRNGSDPSKALYR